MENKAQNWIEGLTKTRKSTFGKIANLLGASEINQTTWDDLEGLLIQSDLGVETTLEVINNVKNNVSADGITKSVDLMNILQQELVNRLITPPPLKWLDKPSVILITGVNGSGKTTSIAKLGQYFLKRDKEVLFIAADTFRAAASEQLSIWGDKLGIPVVTGQMDGDPGAVVYDGINSAVTRGTDLVIVDTAGRLHTRYNLMEELKKVHRVAGKALDGAPHASWLVIDATTGQNALFQAESFLDVIPIDGIILAKLDSSAKGGMAFAIQKKLDLPILFAGLGEGPGDLVQFDTELFVSGILSEN